MMRFQPVFCDPNLPADGVDESGWRLLKRLRRQFLMPLYSFPDRGRFGLTPLRTHILICGFPRAGTTLLQMMLENGLPDARRFGREVGGWRAAAYSWRNHAVIVSKVPHDVVRLDTIRAFYAGRTARLRVLLVVRDPRDVLTSRRSGGVPPGYVVGAERWRTYHAAFLRQRQNPDALVVRYEDLVADPDAQQQRIEAFTGEPVRVPFSRFHEVPRSDFDTSTLNGLRPVERTLVSRWRSDEHRPRIQQVLAELPELPDALVDLGYEPDHAWVDDWMPAGRTVPAPIRPFEVPVPG